jgi:hypothetical protein
MMKIRRIAVDPGQSEMERIMYLVIAARSDMPRQA